MVWMMDTCATQTFSKKPGLCQWESMNEWYDVADAFSTFPYHTWPRSMSCSLSYIIFIQTKSLWVTIKSSST